MVLDLGAAVPYGTIDGMMRRVRSQRPYIPCLGRRNATHQKTERVIITNPDMDCINSLAAMGGHDRPLFDKLLWCLVTSPIFVRC